MEEIWKDVRGYEGMYQVSNLGRVKSLSRRVECVRPRMTNERILKQSADGKGYMMIQERLQKYIDWWQKHLSQIQRISLR